jgi:hypothetical protein
MRSQECVCVCLAYTHSLAGTPPTLRSTNQTSKEHELNLSTTNHPAPQDMPARLARLLCLEVQLPEVMQQVVCLAPQSVLRYSIYLLY